jgi:hypothetical protein
MAEAAVNITARRGMGASGSMISFPISANTTSIVESFAKGNLAIVVLRVDIFAETITLDFSRNALDLNFMAMEEITSGNGSTEPRFILFRWKSKIIFASTVPGSAKIKERLESSFLTH